MRNAGRLPLERPRQWQKHAAGEEEEPEWAVLPFSRRGGTAWNEEAKDEGKERKTDTTNGVDGITLGETFLPSAVDVGTEASIELRRGIGNGAPRGTSEGNESKMALAVTAKNGWGNEPGSKGAEGRPGKTAGSARAGCPRPLRGARRKGIKERPEMERKREGRSEGFQPDGVKAHKGKAPAASKYAWHRMRTAESARLGGRP